jgi:hypothetical protein
MHELAFLEGNLGDLPADLPRHSHSGEWCHRTERIEGDLNVARLAAAVTTDMGPRTARRLAGRGASCGRMTLPKRAMETRTRLAPAIHLGRGRCILRGDSRTISCLRRSLCSADQSSQAVAARDGSAVRLRHGAGDGRRFPVPPMNNPYDLDSWPQTVT